MSYWEQYEMSARLAQILSDVPHHEPEHHLGRPYLTEYQVAIEFAQRYPDDTAQIGLPIGGSGTGEHRSLAKYIARELSTRIRDGHLPDVEGGFLSNQHLEDVSFHNGNETLHSSLTTSGSPLSMFRLRV